jgi:hypothetical protein
VKNLNRRDCKSLARHQKTEPPAHGAAMYAMKLRKKLEAKRESAKK